jgi:hypothetical protein
MNCNQIVWYKKSVKITGQDIPTANVGGWTFNVHHKLNIQSGKFILFNLEKLKYFFGWGLFI